MTCHSRICSVLALLPCLGLGAAQGTAAPAVPGTPAGQTLQRWLSAFNSGDRAQLQEYVKTVDPTASVEGMLAFHDGTGGFDLLSVEAIDPLHIQFRLKEKASPTNAWGNLFVQPGQPAKVKAFYMRPLPPGVSPDHVVVDAAVRQRVIEGVATNLHTAYIDAALAQQMIDAVQAHASKGDYNGISDGDVFAARLTEDLQAVSHDKHLRVTFDPFKMPAQSEPTAEDIAHFHQQLERRNCGFEKVELLPHNIAYVKFNEFADASFCGSTVAAAMGFIQHADAVIFDIRENGGGQPAMVTLIASYLFERPTHLIDMYNRQEDSTVQNWTLSYLPGNRLTRQPVYVLTAARTFSGAEEFAFDLKNQK
ncbi:MAG: S41 family peptidase, partial [Rhodospirillales bacterium]|nr:S41 family peptidase [Acetobacter sp.]